MKEQFKPFRSSYLFLSPITCFPEYNRCTCGTQRHTAAHRGSPMVKNGTKVAQKGAQMAQNGSRRLTKISPNPQYHYQKYGFVSFADFFLS